MDMRNSMLLPKPVLPTIAPQPAATQPFPLNTSLLPASEMLSSDTFVRRAAPASSPGKSLAAQLYEIHTELSGNQRQKFWSDLNKTNQKLNDANANPADINGLQPQNVQLVNQIQALSPAQKVDFVKQLTGDQSAYSRFAESILLKQQAPSSKETRDLFTPNPNSWTDPAAIQAAFSTMAIGLLTLPIILPAMAIASPASLGMLATQIGLALL